MLSKSIYGNNRGKLSIPLKGSSGRLIIQPLVPKLGPCLTETSSVRIHDTHNGETSISKGIRMEVICKLFTVN